MTTYVDNQHRKIFGYRELGKAEIDLMNTIKDHAPDLADLVVEFESLDNLDQRWVAIGKTHLQQGLMALTRAVAKPEFF